MLLQDKDTRQEDHRMSEWKWVVFHIQVRGSGFYNWGADPERERNILKR